MREQKVSEYKVCASYVLTCWLSDRVPRNLVNVTLAHCHESAAETNSSPSRIFKKIEKLQWHILLVLSRYEWEIIAALKMPSEMYKQWYRIIKLMTLYAVYLNGLLNKLWKLFKVEFQVSSLNGREVVVMGVGSITQARKVPWIIRAGETTGGTS